MRTYLSQYAVKNVRPRNGKNNSCDEEKATNAGQKTDQHYFFYMHFIGGNFVCKFSLIAILFYVLQMWGTFSTFLIQGWFPTKRFFLQANNWNISKIKITHYHHRTNCHQWVFLFCLNYKIISSELIIKVGLKSTCKYIEQNHELVKTKIHRL